MPTVEIIDDTNIKDYQELSLHESQVRNILRNFQFSNSGGAKVLEITYGLRFKGSIEALNYSAQYVPRSVNITNIGNGSLTFYYYGQGTIEQLAPIAKTEKNNLVHLLNLNQKEVGEYFELQKGKFELSVEGSVHAKFNAVVDKKRGLDLL